ncbi:MAG: transglycosylase domain-containing protein [Bacteroidia bacterium]|nr:transglycosylase domain-containing protein [Bacteroidia bacterium]
MQGPVVLEENPQLLPPQPASRPPMTAFQMGRRILGIMIAMVSLVITGFVLYTASDLPPLSEIENPDASLSTQVISADGVVLDNFFIRENRVNVRLNEVSPYLVDALIATEDARFYEHSGVDLWSIPAIIKRYFSGTTSGGSTITMQLSRNLFNVVNQDRTVNRKIKEVIVSAVLENKYTKQEIMEAYLNTVNIYGNTYGVETASERLFGKSSSNLNPEEAAVMVAMLKGQGVFDPIRHPDTVIARRNLVFDLMVKHGFLDPARDKVDSLKQRPLVVTKQTFEHERGIAPYFRQEVRTFMKDWCSKNFRPDGKPWNLYEDGLRVYTTLDSRMQLHAESAVKEHLSYLQPIFVNHIKGREAYRTHPDIIELMMRESDRYRNGLRAGKTKAQIQEEFDVPVRMTVFGWEGDIDTVLSPRDSLKYHSAFLETGFVAIEPANGQVKAWVGGINYRRFKYDHVATGKRQVGSTFKPFVYAAALDKGRKPCDLELNQPVVFENTDGLGTRWVPKNSDGDYGGLMTLRSALAASVNLITARLMKWLGPQTVVDYAYRAGIKSRLDPVPALCLGTTDLSVYELTGAYSTFVNNGVRTDPYFVTRIEDRRGNVLAEFRAETSQAINPTTSYVLIQMLRGVIDQPGGTANRIRRVYKFKNEIAGKTGTTQNHSDGWFIGCTPNLVAGAWVGCADRRMRFRSIALGQGASMALPIWGLFMQRVYADPKIGLPQDKFKAPDGYKEEPCVGTAHYGGGGGGGGSKPAAGKSDDFDSFE